MNRHLAKLWSDAFDRAFLDYRARGASEDVALALAERDASAEMDKYCDDKFEEQRTR